MTTLILMWWLAILSPRGEVVYMEYHSQAGCRIIQSAYQRSHVRVTLCQYREVQW